MISGSFFLVKACGSSKWKLLSHVQLFVTPMDYTVLQARILKWVALPFSRGSSQPRERTQVSHIAGGFFTSWATRAVYFIALTFTVLFIVLYTFIKIMVTVYCSWYIYRSRSSLILLSQEIYVFVGVPGGSEGEESTCNAGYLSSIPGSGRSPGEGKGYPLQCSCLGNSMDRGA